ncbi:MAG: flagellar hook-length control protein FliK [Burkholderiales bacterium]|nr:flagellar hook-length control protein FliK [Burkholderiales bacterium]
MQLELSAGNAAARIEVSPPELGPVELHIRVADGAAHLACAAPHPATREAILEALPRLRDMLAAQGLALGEASVGAELPGRERGDARAPRAPAAAAAPGEVAARALAPAAPAVRRGLLDVFA